MSFYKKSDMVFSDYYWTAYGSDSPKITGRIDNTELNRHEGYEMLYFINKYAEIAYFTDIADGKKAERLIRTFTPTNIRTQSGIRDWLTLNWNRH